VVVVVVVAVVDGHTTMALPSSAFLYLVVFDNKIIIFSIFVSVFVLGLFLFFSLFIILFNLVDFPLVHN